MTTSTSATATPAERPPLTWGTKLLYASGAGANAIKQRGISTFLLIFYNQVVGLPAHVVSTAIMIALIFDAFADPTVGQVSDNWRSRWGRRHPFMYASALPVSLAFFLIWNPPLGWETGALFGYMLACLLMIRLFDTFFELPSSALVAELTTAYNERTTLISLRYLFGVIAGLGMTLAVYQVFLRENPDGTGGITSREGWLAYSIVGAIAIFAIILISTASTHKFIPHLRKPPSRKITVAGMAREVAHTLSNRSFVVLTISGVFMFISLGLKGALELYFLLYFWGFTQAQLSILTVGGVIASIVGVSLAPRVSAKLGKRNGAMIVFFSAVVVGVAPIGLRLLDVMPPNGTDLLFYIMLVDSMVNGALAVMTGVMLASMMADVVEDSELKTGRRSEGLLMSADNLFKKIVSGVGVFVSGALLSFIQFPQGARRGEVDPEVLRNLALAYLPTVSVFYAISIASLFLYRIDQATHEANLRKLREAAIDVPTTDASIEGGSPAAAGPSGDVSPVTPKV